MQPTSSRLALFFLFAALSACRSEGLDPPGSPAGGIDAKRGAPAPCSSYTDVASCEAHACVAFECPSCSGAKAFAGCSEAEFGAPACEPPICPQPSCPGLTQSECEQSEQCHAVYAPADTFSCTGCAPPFLSCNDGPARCSGFTCAIVPPVCSPGYRVGYEPNGCEVGCVRESACTFDKNDCRTNGCAPGLDCIQCASPAWECLSDCA